MRPTCLGFARLSPVLLVLLAGCQPAAPPRLAAPPPPAPVVAVPGGLAGVVGAEADALAARFGPPTLDLREGRARKLQWRGPACVLDAYLYPPAAGGAPRATWLDARTAAGGDMDRASCVAALARAHG